MKLYEIEKAIETFEPEVDEKTGELLNADELDKLQMEEGRKFDNIGCLIKNWRAEAKAIQEEEIALAKRRKALENKAARMEQYLSDALGGRKFESARCVITYRKSTVVEFDNIGETIDWLQNNRDDLLRYKTPEINKAEVKMLLKNGGEVFGAKLVERQTMGVK